MGFGELSDEAPDFARGACVKRIAEIDERISVRLGDADHELAVLGLLSASSGFGHGMPSWG
ncbi:hypothetical protein [Roseovarius autotrophicus]|uniref:hypothetical protein n=1 Tax=Roseovarius autotrophicus TaxID=2824121 RepID=UPI001B365C54|nr:hypothetical protein [Roseovarius autotrophicus]